MCNHLAPFAIILRQMALRTDEVLRHGAVVTIIFELPAEICRMFVAKEPGGFLDGVAFVQKFNGIFVTLLG